MLALGVAVGCGSQVEYGAGVAENGTTGETQAAAEGAASEAPPFEPDGDPPRRSEEVTNQETSEEATEKEPVSEEALIDWITGETKGPAKPEASSPENEPSIPQDTEPASEARYPWQSDVAESEPSEGDFGAMLAGQPDAVETEEPLEPAAPGPETLAEESSQAENPAPQDDDTDTAMNAIFGFDEAPADASTGSPASEQPAGQPEEEQIATTANPSDAGGFGGLLAEDLANNNAATQAEPTVSEPTLAEPQVSASAPEPDAPRYASSDRYGTPPTEEESLPFFLEESSDEAAEGSASTEPNPYQQPSASPPIVETLPEPLGQDSAPAAEVAYQPPPLPMDVTNTRRLAWLLGERISLEVLGQIDRSSPVAVETWETDALAELLDVPTPRPTDAGTASPEEAITALLGAAKPVGDRIAREHDAAHAALMEIALKTNALLKLYEARPELGPIVGRSVEAAAERASLPADIWQPLVDQLASSTTSEAMQTAVYRLHADVEQWLRQ